MDYDREFGTTGTPGYSSRRGYGIDRDYDDYGFQTDYGYMRDPNRDREYYDRDEERNRGRAGEGYYRRTARGYGYEGDRDTDYERGQRGREDRGWLGRMTDEVRSWFGDEDFERERRRDERRGGMYRGRGPRGYRRSDDRIKEDINDRLTDHPYLDASDIEVIVAAGEVTLTGLVDSRNAKRMAEEIAEDVSGVANVENRLKVRQDRWETSRRDALTDTGTTQTNTGSEAAATTSTGSSGRRSS
jgi:osmotically-inducible protein OsmY